MIVTVSCAVFGRESQYPRAILGRMFGSLCVPLEHTTIIRQKTLVVWFFVHCEVMLVRHCSRASRRARGTKAQGPKAQGPKVLVFEGTRAEGARAEGARPKGVGVCVCVWGMQSSTCLEVSYCISQRTCCCDTKSRHSGSDAYCTGQSSRQGAAGLRASLYDRRGLQAVKPSTRRGRGELREGTPPNFRATSAMELSQVIHIWTRVLGWILLVFFISTWPRWKGTRTPY